MRGDGRSRRVAVVPDAYLNPGAGSDDHLVGLAAAGWGVVALPQPGLPPDVERAALAAVADQLTAFLDDGYEVALAEPDEPIGGRLNELLGARGRELARAFPRSAAGVAEPGPGGPMPKHSKARRRLEGNVPPAEGGTQDPRSQGRSQDPDPRAKNTQHRKKTADKWNQ